MRPTQTTTSSRLAPAESPSNHPYTAPRAKTPLESAYCPTVTRYEGRLGISSPPAANCVAEHLVTRLVLTDLLARAHHHPRQPPPPTTAQRLDLNAASNKPSMTTLVETRRALELLSMGNQQERRTSKRLAGTYPDHHCLTQGRGGRKGNVQLTDGAAPANLEQDGDFMFVRETKRVKTEEPEPPKRAGRGRPPKGRPPKEAKVIAEIPEEQEATPVAATTKSTTRKSARRKASEDVMPEEPAPKVQKTTTRRSTRHASEDVAVVEEVRAERTHTNGASNGRGRKKGKSTKAAREPEMVPVQEQAVQSAQISLPMSDTPIINRNKEMRKKGSNRRSSLGSRGRRASSLIESGQTAIPHREVNPAEFYKHIEEGLTETRRMKQLLTWCGERALAVKPAHGTKNSSIIHGGRALHSLFEDYDKANRNSSSCNSRPIT